MSPDERLARKVGIEIAIQGLALCYFLERKMVNPGNRARFVRAYNNIIDASTELTAIICTESKTPVPPHPPKMSETPDP